MTFAILRLGVTAILVVLVVRSRAFRDGYDIVRTAMPIWVAVAIAVGAAMIVVSAARWQRLLTVAGVQLSSFDAIRHTFVGTLLATATIGPVSGDALRIYRASRGGRLGPVVGGTFVDRVLGTLGLLAVAAVAALVAPTTPRSATAFVVILLGVGIAACVLAAAVSRSVRAKRVVAVLPKRGRELFRKLHRAFLPYRRAPRALAVACVLSVLVQLLGITTAVLLARSIALDIDALTLAWVYSIVLVVQSVPLTVAGIGTREGAMVYLLSRQGLAPGEALGLSILILFVTVTVAVLGALVDIAPGASRRDRKHASTPLAPASGAVPDKNLSVDGRGPRAGVE